MSKKDLIDIKRLPNYEVNEKVKYHFKFILEAILIITNSILMGVLSDIWLLKSNETLSLDPEPFFWIDL